MTLKELKDYFYGELSSLYPEEEVQSFFVILLDHLLGYSRLDSVVRSSEIISEEHMAGFNNAVLRLQQHEPIQYITGTTLFYDLPFKVNRHTLIPRPETEELVAWIIEDAKEKKSLEILDIGTGSGCIAVSLAKNLENSRVSALDISSETIDVAQANAQVNDIQVTFIQKDILQESTLPESYDIIVSNPPYVRELEKREMEQNVLGFEPELALFVSNEDPLVFYRKITQFAKDHLKVGGFLFFEINEYLSKEMTVLLSSNGFRDIVVRKDIFGKDRMVKGTFHG